MWHGLVKVSKRRMTLAMGTMPSENTTFGCMVEKKSDVSGVRMCSQTTSKYEKLPLL